MTKRIIMILCALVTVSAVAVAQSSHVVGTRVLLDSCGFFPQVSADGRWLMYSPLDARQLMLKDLATGEVREVSHDGYPGFDAIFGRDGKVYYVTQQRKGHHLLHRTGRCYDPATGKDRRVLKGQHGRVQPLNATAGTVIQGERRSYLSARQVGSYAYTRGDSLFIQRGDGTLSRLHPVSGSNGYLWASLSPDGTRVLFQAASRGLYVCDLQGNIVSELGAFLMPCWYNDQYIVAMSNAGNDRITGSRIWLIAADGSSVEALTPDTERAIQPVVAAGTVIYTIQYDGTIKQLTLDLPATTSPVVTAGGKGKTVNVKGAAHRDRPRVYINPGHGGHDSDDRHLPTWVIGVGDTVHYYESNSNLTKGLALQQILAGKGYETAISRVTNTTQDDLDLFEIVCLAANSGADIFFAIHSNATGTTGRVNFPLGLYRGWDNGEAVEGSLALSQAIMRHLGECEATVWTDAPRSRGDWSFYDWGYRVGLGVLRYNKLPGLLSEGAFHDYLPERERLLNDDYCWLEAWNQSLGIDEYFDRRSRMDDGVVAGIVRLAQSVRQDVGEQLHGADTLRTANGAMVRLIDNRGMQSAQYTVDNQDNGVFVFKHVRPGDYTLEVTHHGVTQRCPITVGRNTSTYHNFNL